MCDLATWVMLVPHSPFPHLKASGKSWSWADRRVSKQLCNTGFQCNMEVDATITLNIDE